MRRLALIDVSEADLALLRVLGAAPDVHVVACHLARPADAEGLFFSAGWNADRCAAAAPQQALREGRTYLSGDASAVISAPGVDVVRLAGANAVAGLSRALLALELGRDVIEANAACAALVGPLLAQRAAENGLSYRLDAGSRLGRALQQAAQEPEVVVIGTDDDAAAMAAAAYDPARYRVVEHDGAALLVRNDLPPTDLPSFAPQPMNRVRLSGAVELSAADDNDAAATLELVRALPAAQAAIPRRFELACRTTVDLGEAQPAESAVLRPWPVPAGEADRGGLVPWPLAAGCTLRRTLPAGQMLSWDDIEYQTTDPTVRMVLLQRRRLPAQEA